MPHFAAKPSVLPLESDEGGKMNTKILCLVLVSLTLTLTAPPTLADKGSWLEWTEFKSEADLRRFEKNKSSVKPKRVVKIKPRSTFATWRPKHGWLTVYMFSKALKASDETKLIEALTGRSTHRTADKMLPSGGLEYVRFGITLAPNHQISKDGRAVPIPSIQAANLIYYDGNDGFSTAPAAPPRYLKSLTLKATGASQGKVASLTVLCDGESGRLSGGEKGFWFHRWDLSLSNVPVYRVQDSGS
jgi:hypothetical protein